MDDPTMDDGFRGLRLTNTLTRRKEEFRPLDWAQGSGVAPEDRKVRMYVCGPTVYDHAHIGNARPVIVFDVLFRLLRHLYGKDHVTYVRNITDVDDKINARAARDHPDLPLNDAIRRVTEATAARFQKDAAALGCLAPTHEPRATEFVGHRSDGKPDMVSMIATLIAKGNAYAAGGEVLFDVTSMPDYGRLSNRRLEDQQAGARVAVESHKRNPGDFVLWKLSDENEPGWEAPFGQAAWTAAGRTGKAKGRPGWHIECSVMSEAYLGKTFDIHGGGLDLIFPHHENEIAQSRCAHGTDVMAQIWMHNGFLQLEGRKMSKSEGNFVTISELLETDTFGGRTWPGEVLRLAILMTHYREPIDFTVRRLEEAEAHLQKWAYYFTGWSEEGSGFGDPHASPSGEQYGGGMAGVQTVLDELCDDLSTPFALAITHAINEPSELWAVLDILGVDLKNYVRQQKELRASKASSMDIGGKIAERAALLEVKNFAEADRIRAELLAQGIQLKDGKDPVTGERLTTWEVKR